MAYYEANRDVANKVAEELVKNNKVDLIAYYLTIAFEDDQHTYMNDLAWVYDRATASNDYYGFNWSDEKIQNLENHIREMIDIDDSDILQFEKIFGEERPEIFEREEY
jgi:hypothetical protein